MPSSSPHMLTAEDLERRLVEEYNAKKQRDEQQRQQSSIQHDPPQPSNQRPNESEANNYPGMYQPGKMPTMSQMQMAQQMQQFYQWQQAMAAAAMASANGAPGNMLPPGFPPPMMPPYGAPNPAMFAAMMASRMPYPHPPPGLPPMGGPGFMTPPQMNQDRSQPGTPINRSSYNLMPQGAVGEFPNSPRNGPMGCPSPCGSTASSRRTRKEGMPSLRTITDFAVDPYAGFMSKKEREWLIKIQLIQCLGTGDRYNDDYYYTVSYFNFTVVVKNFMIFSCGKRIIPLKNDLMNGSNQKSSQNIIIWKKLILQIIHLHHFPVHLASLQMPPHHIHDK